MKKIVSLGMGLTMMALSAVPAMAANVSIGTTGPFSLNIVKVNNRSKIKVNNIQFAAVNNTVNNTVNTGGNSNQFNTNSTGGTTGNASSNTTIDNQINGSVTQINDCGCVPDTTNVTLNTTGPFSKNIVKVDNSKSTKVNNVNVALVKNDVNNNVNSGGNNTNFNTVVGAGGTGSASSNTNVTNWLNNSSTIINATPTP